MKHTPTPPRRTWFANVRVVLEGLLLRIERLEAAQKPPHDKETP